LSDRGVHAAAHQRLVPDELEGPGQRVLLALHEQVRAARQAAADLLRHGTGPVRPVRGVSFGRRHGYGKREHGERRGHLGAPHRMFPLL